MFVNLRGGGDAFEISEHAAKTRSCALPENCTDVSAAHGSARNPDPSCRAGLAGASIEIHGGGIVERILTKDAKMRCFGRTGRKETSEVIAQVSRPFDNPVDLRGQGRGFRVAFQQDALAMEPGDDFQRLLLAFTRKL